MSHHAYRTQPIGLNRTTRFENHRHFHSHVPCDPMTQYISFVPISFLDPKFTEEESHRTFHQWRRRRTEEGSLCFSLCGACRRARHQSRPAVAAPRRTWGAHLDGARLACVVIDGGGRAAAVGVEHECCSVMSCHDGGDVAGVAERGAWVEVGVCISGSNTISPPRAHLPLRFVIESEREPHSPYLRYVMHMVGLVASLEIKKINNHAHGDSYSRM
jgi:hypothetical protein